MKHINYLLIIFCITFHAVEAFSNKSFMTYRSQGVNNARNNSGWLHRCTRHNASIAVEYTQSFDQEAINQYFFGCDKLIFSGSRVQNRGTNHILADYFGLPTDFKSCLSFSPQIHNVIADLDLYWNLGSLDTGWNFRINVPLVHTKWKLNPCETIIQTGTSDYPAGYMSKEFIARDELPHGALDVLMCGKQFGDLVSPLEHGRIVASQHLTKVSDIFAAIGYTCLCSPKAHCDINALITIPTGTRSDAVTLFEPQIGNGHHWGLGAELNVRCDFMQGEDRTTGISGEFDMCIQHLFKTTQKRSYDLCNNGPGSRYMLLQDMISQVSVTEGFSNAFPLPDDELIQNQYITRLLYAVDATTLDSTIQINVQAEILAKLSMQYHHWHCDIGYNFWVRSPEKLVSRKSLDHQFYAIKGDAQLYGFFNVGFEIPLPGNATQSQATLYAPQPDGNTTDNFVNNNADNPALLFNAGFPIGQTTAASVGENTGITSVEQINGSKQAIVLSDSDINESSGLSPRAFSNKVFASLCYDCNYTDRVSPYFVVGAEGEFAGKENGVQTAISQWGVWVKGGINY